ncbi:MAG: CBS domain-containing protein [Alphaproteobacteria bacterium]|nr:CBS domain-containing protein [Alphaproteobacteria bacterium]
MNCSALINDGPAPLRAENTLGEAAEILARASVQSLPVITADGDYVGVFGISEILARIIPRVAVAGDMRANVRFIADDLSELRAKFEAIAPQLVRDWCNMQAAFVRPDTPAPEALRLFCRGHDILPVVGTNGKLLGLVSPSAAIRVISARSDKT